MSLQVEFYMVDNGLKVYNKQFKLNKIYELAQLLKRTPQLLIKIYFYCILKYRA